MLTWFRTPLAGIADVERDLHTTSGLISLSLSLYIVLQGGMPILWSSISEIVGRKVRHDYLEPSTLN